MLNRQISIIDATGGPNRKWDAKMSATFSEEALRVSVLIRESFPASDVTVAHIDPAVLQTPSLPKSCIHHIPPSFRGYQVDTHR